MNWIKQSTAVDIPLGPFVDSTDGVTPETALTISQADVRLKKGAAAWAQKNQASSATHEENGWYEASLDATDTDTLGSLMVAVNESGALPVWREFTVLPANVYDSLVSGTDQLDVNIIQIAEDGNAATNLRAFMDGTGYVGGTAKLTVNAVQISGDTVAADNLEAEYDGTGFKSYLRRNTAQAGAAATITLDAAASAVDDFYNNLIIGIVSGTGAGQGRLITDYVGATKVATVNTAWATNPDATSVFVLLPADIMLADMVKISADAAAADNLETMLDGTGTGTLTLKQISVSNSTGTAVIFQSTGGNGLGLDARGNGVGPGIQGTGGSVAAGIVGSGGSTSGAGFQLLAASGPGILSTGGTNGPGAQLIGGGTGPGLYMEGGATAPGMRALGGSTSGDGVRFEAVTSGHGINAIGINNSHGLLATGAGTGEGGRFVGGVTGHGMEAVGGSTSGDGFRLTVTSGVPLNDDLHSGLLQAGATSSTAVLDAGAAANDDVFNGLLLVIHTGTGARQARVIMDYDGTTKTATITPAWDTTPAAADAFSVVEWGSVSINPVDTAVQHFGTAQAGAATTITLAASASATSSLYNGEIIKLYGGTGAGQTRTITAYNGATKVATVDRAWITNPDNTSTYSILASSEAALDSSLRVLLQDNAVTASAVATAAITAAKFAAGAIDAAALATDAANEIRDAVWAQAMTELSAVPGVTASTLAALTWVFELARNRITQTATTQTVFKDDGATTLATSAVSDDGTTYVRAEFV